MALATARALSPQLDEIDPEMLRQAQESIEIEKFEPVRTKMNPDVVSL